MLSLSFITWDICNYVVTNKDMPVIKILTQEELEKLKNKKKNKHQILPLNEIKSANLNQGRLPSNAGGKLSLKNSLKPCQ